MTHERALISIERHFAGRTEVREETELRLHLPECDPCRARYERHLLYESLTRGRGPKQRLASGLGFRIAPEPASWQRRAAAATGLTAAAALAIAAVVVVARPDGPSNRDFGARRGPGAPAAALLVYRMHPGATPVQVQNRISRDDELAFAYSNPDAKKYLWIFGVDEHRHVYWYYPAWPEGTPAPRPFAAEPGPGPHELPEAVRHGLAGSRLELYALTSDEPITISEIEARVAASGSVELANATAVRRSLEVGP
jgi:hypothetical protein